MRRLGLRAVSWVETEDQGFALTGLGRPILHIKGIDLALPAGRDADEVADLQPLFGWKGPCVVNLQTTLHVVTHVSASLTPSGTGAPNAGVWHTPWACLLLLCRSRTDNGLRPRCACSALVFRAHAPLASLPRRSAAYWPGPVGAGLAPQG